MIGLKLNHILAKTLTRVFNIKYPIADETVGYADVLAIIVKANGEQELIWKFNERFNKIYGVCQITLRQKEATVS